MHLIADFYKPPAVPIHSYAKWVKIVHNDQLQSIAAIKAAGGGVTRCHFYNQTCHYSYALTQDKGAFQSCRAILHAVTPDPQPIT